MDQGHQYSTSYVLSEVASALEKSHGNLQVTLENNRATLQDALSAALDSVAGLPDRISLPITNPARRQRLRDMALENLRSEEALSSRQVNRPIRTQGLLTEKNMPSPPSQQQRSFVRKLADDENDKPPKLYTLNLRSLLSEGNLAAVLGNVSLSAIDWDEGMPTFEITGVEILWDTGATSTIITSDILSDDFRRHLSDPVHQNYTNDNLTRVQIGAVFEFSNTLFEQESIAWIVDKEAVPNCRSGIILGQKGCIDRIQYTSIPRAVLEAAGETVDKKYWGDLVIQSYVDSYETLQYV